MKVRDKRGADSELNPFESIKRKAKRNQVKTTLATEALVGSLAEREAKLSRQVLALSKLYRACYRLLPQQAKAQIDRLRAEIDSLDGLEVHP